MMTKVKVLFVSLSSFPAVLISPVVSFIVKGRPKNEYRNNLKLPSLKKQHIQL